MPAAIGDNLRPFDALGVRKDAQSLGRKLRDAPETFAWRDESGAEVEIEFVDGRCRQWRLTRSDGDSV